MLSVHLEGGIVQVRTVPSPEPPPGFALLRLIYGGICSTDLELQRGYYGFSGTPGHEFVAEVVAAPDDPAWLGRRVVGEINLNCHACDWCSRDLGRHCPNRTVLGIVNQPGAFSEFFTLPLTNLRLVPDSVSSEHAVFVEPLAAACEILDQVEIPPTASVAVLGDGKLGLLVAQVLKTRLHRLVHFGRHAAKLRISEAAGIQVEPAGHAPDRGFGYVVDCTGSASGLQEAVRMTKPRGVLILKSTVHGLVPVDTAPIIVNELTLIGSRCGRFEPALGLLASGRVQVQPLIDCTFALAEAPQAFARAAEKGVLKVLLRG